MQQQNEKSEPRHQEQPPAPQKCPRCESFNTKFRYYNNNDRAQPRHYCKTCKRYWTVGGSLRNVPVGGSRRYGKQTQDSSLIHNNPIPTLMSPLASIVKEEWQRDSKNPTLFPHMFGETTYQSHESLTRLQMMSGSFNTVNQFGEGIIGTSMAPQQPSLQRFPSHGDRLFHPTRPTNSLSFDLNNDFSFSSGTSSWKFKDPKKEPETTETSINLNPWRIFPH